MGGSSLSSTFDMRSAALLCLLGALSADPACAQTNFPQVMPPNTVYGGLDQSGPGVAIPFSVLGGLLTTNFGGLINMMPANTYLCNPTNQNGVPAQACPPYSVAAPLFLNTSTNILSATASSSSSDTFVGQLAGAAAQSGGANLGFPNEGTNSAFGSLALNRLTVGSGNVAIGNGALLVLTIGVNNAAIGVNSQAANISGVGNVSMGSSSLGSLTVGQSNVAIGATALGTATGSNNVGVGPLALADQTTGASNTAIGPSAGRGITTGSSNTVIGNCTGLSATLGNAVVLCDGANNVRFDWAKTSAATLTMTGPVVVTGGGVTATGFTAGASAGVTKGSGCTITAITGGLITGTTGC